MAESLRAIPESRALFSLSAVADWCRAHRGWSGTWRARTMLVGHFLLACRVSARRCPSGRHHLGRRSIHGRAAGAARRITGSWAKLGSGCWRLLLASGLNGQSRAHRASWPWRRRSWARECCSSGGTQRPSYTAPWAFCSWSGCWPSGRRSSGAVPTRRSSRRGPRQPMSQNWAQDGPAAGFDRRRALSFGEALPSPRGSVPECRARPSAGQPRT